jgi:hypothetical protein
MKEKLHKFTQSRHYNVHHAQILNTVGYIVLAMSTGRQKRRGSSFVAALRVDDPTVLVDCIDDQLDGSQEAAYSIWDLQR